jgi:hypothetical protein
LNDPFRQRGWEAASSSPFIIEGDLGIRDWLFGAILTDVFIPSQKDVRPSPGGSHPPRKPARLAPATTGAGGGNGNGNGGSTQGGGVKPDTMSYEIKFVIVSNGNITPTWKLINVSANTSGNFFSAGRTRTHDLIITIGPDDQRTLLSHWASEVGQSVSGASAARPLQ